MATNDRTPFEQALADAMLEEFADIPPEEEIDISASESFYKNCSRMIRGRGVHPVSRVRRAVKRCVLAAAIVAAIATTAMAFPNVRKTVYGFFVRNEGVRYEISFDPEQIATAPKVIETVYKVTYIPEEYTNISVDADLSGVCYYWYDNAHRSYIMFDQSVIDEMERIPNAGGSEAEEINLNGYQVFCIRNDSIKYYWTDNSYFYCLYGGNGVSEEQMQKMFSSIRMDDDLIAGN